MNASRSLAAAVAVLATLTITACSDNKSTDKPSESATSAGPLDEFFSSLQPTQDQAAADEQQRHVEEITATCMKDLGWEYTPVDYSAIDGTRGQADGQDIYAEQATMSAIDWAKKYGYGWLTQQTGASDSETEPTDSSSEFVDPNSEYVNSLSATEQTDYQTDLYGAQSVAATDGGDGTDDVEATPAEYTWEDAGCQGKASHEVYGSQEDVWSDPKYKSLMDELNNVYTDAQNSPEVADLNDKWSVCMGDAGFDSLKTPDGVYDILNTLQSSLWDPNTGEQAPDFDAQLEAGKKKEIDMAVADATCKDKLDYVKKQTAASNKIQQAFIDGHADELESLRTAIQEATKK